jgi:WD40 repeat protein
VTAVAVLSDGCVVTAGSDWRVRLWHTDQPGVPIEIGTHDGEVTAVAVLSDGSVVTGGRDGRVRLWRTDQPGVPMALSADDDDQMDKLVTTVHMLPDGHVVTYDVDGVIRLWRTDEPGVAPRLAPKMRTCPYWRFPTVCVVTAVSLRVVSEGFARVASSGVWPGDPSLTPIVFDHLAIAEPESVGESVGVSGSNRLLSVTLMMR